MSNSENENREPWQPADYEGNASQPLENDPDATRPPGRRAHRTLGSQDQAAKQRLSGGEYTGQPLEPLEPLKPLPRSGQPVEGEETPFTPYVDDSEQPSDAHWHDQSQAQLYTEGSRRPVGARVYPSGARAATTPRIRHANLLIGALTGALLCLLLGGLAGWQIGKHNASSQTAGIAGYRSGAMTPEQVIAQDRQAVVQINVKMAKGAGVGSGVIIDSQGHIITNDHVVSGGQSYNVVLFDGTSLPAKLVGVDAADDLAVVKITPPAKMYVMPVGDSSRLEVGNPVLAIGNPLGITQTVTQGIISALGRTVSEGHGGGTLINAVQTDAPINPGNSGGALVGLNGNLIGIPTLVAIDPEFKTPANGVGFAVPSNRVKFIAPQLIQYGKVIHSGRAAIQATVTTVDPRVASQAGLSVDHGVLVVNTVRGGAADRAGLKTGDVITRINNQAIDNLSDLGDVLLTYDPGTSVTVSYVRGTQQNQTKLKLGELKVS